MRSESIKLKWLLGESHSELRSQSLKHGPASLYYDNLKQAILNGDSNTLKEFLEHEDYRCVVNFKGPDGYALIHIAALQADSVCIDLLVDAGTRPNLHDFEGRAALHLIVSKSGCRCEHCIQKRLGCINVLMSRGANPDAEDKNGETPLYYAARNRLAECATLLLEKGSDLQHWNENSTVVSLILKYIPSVLCNELDKSVSGDCTDNMLLKIDFSLLMQVKAIQEGYRKRINSREDLYQDRPPRETELLRHILLATTDQDAILTHPVVETFIHLKWMSVRKFFFVLRSVYFLLTMLYTFTMFDLYSFSKYDKDGIVFSPPPSDEPLKVETSSEVPVLANVLSGDGNNTTDLDYHDILIKSSSGGLLACALIIVLSEVYKICQDAANYFSNPTGYLWWILAVIWSGTLTPPHIPGFTLEHWHFPIASFAVIYTWILNLLQLGRIPWFAVHVALLVNVVTDFIKLLFTFALILVGFTFGFCILIPNNYYFESFRRAAFKVFVMMKGDIDYEMTLDRHNNPLMAFPGYSIPAHIIFTSFVIIVTMLLTGLLIALAVNDIEEVRSRAQVNRSIRLIKEISVFESLIRNRFLTCGLSPFLIKRYSVESRPEIVNSSLHICPTLPTDITLPKDLKEKFLPYLRPTLCQIKRRFRKDYIPIPAHSNNNLLEDEIPPQY